MDETGFESINVIPLVDVMLVLLTIVLTTSTFIAVGALPVELPQGKSCQIDELASVLLEIDRQGGIFLEGEFRSLTDLETILMTRDRKTPVIIRADKNLTLQVFVDVMSVIKNLKFAKVSLQTEVSP